MGDSTIDIYNLYAAKSRVIVYFLHLRKTGAGGAEKIVKISSQRVAMK